MGITKDPPEFNSETIPYEQYKLELDAWTSVTDVPKEKWGKYVALSLPAKDPSDIRNKVFNGLMKDGKLAGDAGYQNLVTYLDGEFGTDEIVGVFNVFEAFDTHKKEEGMTIKQFVSGFELKYKAAKNKGFPELPQEYLMYKVIKGASLADWEEKMVHTDIDYTKKDELFKNAKAGLLKYFGSEKQKAQNKPSTAEDKAFMLNEGKEEEAFYGRDRSGTFPSRGGGGWSNNRWSNNQSGQNQWRSRSQSNNYNGTNGQYGASGGFGNNGGYQQRGNNGQFSNGANYQQKGQFSGQAKNFGQQNGGKPNMPQKRINQPGPDGQPKTCASCLSIRHMVKDCPDSWENMRGAGNQTYYTEGQDQNGGGQDEQSYPVDEEGYVIMFTDGGGLYTGKNIEERALLSQEAKNSLVVDTGCTATVGGQEWGDIMVDSLCEESKKKVEKLPSNRVFYFGGGETLRSQGKWRIPVEIAGTKVMLETDIVTSKIPCLLSRKDLKAMGCNIDLVNDKITLFGNTVDMDLTTAGHYAVEARDPHVPEQVFIGQIIGDYEEKTQRVVKLHKQFAHPKKEPFTQLLKDAQEYDDTVQDILNKIYDKCQICIESSKTKARPVVSMPLATEFNECVAMDLKIHNEGEFIEDKQPETIIRATMDCWSLGPFGPPKKFLADNGGEFANEKYRDMCENMNIQVLKTGAASPFQNGICERNHAVVDNMYDKMREDNPEMDKKLILASCLTAKNSMAMNNGFTPIQLVTGVNPNLPSALSDDPPALEGVTSSRVFANRINAAHQARKAFVHADSSAKVKRALLKKISIRHENYQTGDRVFFKRTKDDKWHGVGKVIGRDGKVIFVKHGRLYVTASPTRLIKANRIFESAGETIDKLGPVQIDNDGNFKIKRDPRRPPVRIKINKKFYARRKDDSDEDDVVIRNVRQNSPQRNEAAEDPVIRQESPEPVIRQEPREQQDQEPLPHPEPVVRPQPRIVRSNSQRAGASQTVYPSKGDKLNCVINNQEVTVEVQGRGGKSTGKNKSYFNVKYPDQTTGGIFLDTIQWSRQEEDETQVNAQNQENPDQGEDDVQEEQAFVVLVPRSMHHLPAVLEAKKKELQNFKDFKVYEIVDDEGQRKLNHGWVITQKLLEDGIMGYKARLVACGNEENQSLRTDSPTISKTTLKIIMAIAALMEWKAESGDIKAAFLQGQKLDRPVHIVPPPEAGDQGKLWYLLKPIYGLNDASRSFYLKLVENLIRLGCKRSKFDYAVFLYHQGNQLEGVIGGHVDDLTYAGTNVFYKNIIQPLKNYFKFGKMSAESFKYVGWSISHDENRIKIDQDDYVEEKCELVRVERDRSQMPEEPVNSKERSALRTVIGRARWLTDQTRPDCAFDELELSMIVNKAKIKDLAKANKMLRKFKAQRVTLNYYKIGEIRDVKITLFTDASYANLPDGMSSAGGYVIFLSTGFQPGVPSPCVPITWQSWKLKRKVTSTMEAETLALREGLEETLVIQGKICEMINCRPQSIKIEAYIDNEDSQQAIYSTKQKLKGRILIDMGIIKDMVEMQEIEHVYWIDKKYQLADSLTKTGAPTGPLIETLNTGLFPKM